MQKSKKKVLDLSALENLKKELEEKERLPISKREQNETEERGYDPWEHNYDYDFDCFGGWLDE